VGRQIVYNSVLGVANIHTLRTTTCIIKVLKRRRKMFDAWFSLLRPTLKYDDVAIAFLTTTTIPTTAITNDRYVKSNQKHSISNIVFLNWKKYSLDCLYSIVTYKELWYNCFENKKWEIINQFFVKRCHFKMWATSKIRSEPSLKP